MNTIEQQSYTWEDFKNELFFSKLLVFFNELFDGDSTVIFVSRKSYCLFLLLREKNVISVGNNPIYADRLIMKSFNPERYRGNKVYLVDDTISTGKHLAEVCEEVLKRTKYENIVLKVFAKEKSFNEPEYRKNFFKDNAEKINLEIKCEMDASDKLRFSSIETLLYHQENIPYFIELPYLAEKGSSKDYIVLSRDEYKKLAEENDSWQFYKCDQLGYRQNIIENAVIIMKNDYSDSFPEFIYDFVVRIQIVTNNDFSKNVIFSPFAILKSVKFEELEKYFFDIFDETEYAECIRKQKTLDEKNYKALHYKTIYRAVVYAFSYYIGIRFTNYLENNIVDKELIFQAKNDQYCYDEEFMNSVHDIFENGYERFFLASYLYEGFSSVERRTNLLPFLGKYGRLENNFRTVYHFLWALFNELRENPSVISERDDELRKFLSIEELQEAISLNCFEKNSNIKDLLTRCICAMLEQSKIANEITYDEERTVVYRGFKFAENSEVVFDIAEKAFFAATFTYLRKVHEEKYKEKYEKFLSVLKEFFVHNNLLGNVITSDEFQIYSEIYRKQSSNNKSEQMNRLLFLIENDKPTYIRELCQYIEEIDWDKV
jgi:hypothetical protein